MKNNIKLFFRSLVNNNSAIDAGRQKPWYAAIAIFFLSIILALVPIGVSELNNKLENVFSATTYNTQEAVTEFAKYLNEENITMFVDANKDTKEHKLVCDENMFFEYPAENSLFVFDFAEEESVSDLKTLYEKKSFFIFTEDSLFIRIVNPNDFSDVIPFTYCRDAYKKIGKDQIKDSYVEVFENDTLHYTKTLEKTWGNWKNMLSLFHKQTRLVSAGMNVAILGGVDALVALLMGFMVWILTRGKNNPYRLFGVWECFKISFWACMAPGLLTCALGFLMANLARTMFPLLVGVRIMWLSMKSLRPDGSGYAAN